MSFEPIAEIAADPASTVVYEEGWQSWSPAALHCATELSPRPVDAVRHTMGWRPGKALPAVGFQGEGILGLAVDGLPARVWFSPDPSTGVASIRVEASGERLFVASDGKVDELSCDAGLDAALALTGDRLSAGAVGSIPPGWCSWSCYFGRVTEGDVAENLAAADELSLPIQIVQVDDGWQAGIGDWLDVDHRFGSLRRTADRILAAGRRPGIWTAPFLVGEQSALAQTHPDWLVADADAGWNWDQRLRVLDVTHPPAAAHLERVYRTLSDWGFTYHKLDFLYAGAVDGGRRADCSALDAYREGLRLIRLAAGAEAILLACGAPLLPSIGLVDAMRVGPDVLPEPPGTPDLRQPLAVTRARAWMHGRLWANDPDCLVARPEIAEREQWAAHVGSYGGLAFSSDRLEALDERGLELTKRVLRPSSEEPRFAHSGVAGSPGR